MTHRPIGWPSGIWWVWKLNQRCEDCLTLILFSFNSQAHSFLYSYIPFVLLAINNLLLIHSIRSHHTITLTNSSKTKQRSLNKTVLLITALFIVLTLPSSIASIYYDQLIVSSAGFVILIALDSLTFSYHSFNIFVLLYTNKKFKRDFKVFICFWRKDLRLDGSYFGSSTRQKPTSHSNQSV